MMGSMREAPSKPVGPSRRTILTVAGGVIANASLLAIPILNHFGWLSGGAFTRELVMPPIVTGTLRSDGSQLINLAVASGHAELIDGAVSLMLGYNGISPGPTLVVRRGSAVTIRIQNRLQEATTVHWHGAHVPGILDGGPHNAIAAGGVLETNLVLEQPGATLWYHPHAMGRTGPQVYGGLSGLLLVADGEDERLGLPHHYGVDDLPLIVQDRRFDATGQLVYLTSPADMMGMKGNRFLVNGREQPFVHVPAQWIRLRLINGSNARLYNFGFADGRSFHVIASDGGLLPHPVAMNTLLLAPAERAEIMVDLSHDLGQKVILRHVGVMELSGLSSMPTDFDNYDMTGVDLLQLKVGPRLAAVGALRLTIANLPMPDVGGAATRRFVLGDRMDMSQSKPPQAADSDLAMAENLGIPICVNMNGASPSEKTVGLASRSTSMMDNGMFLINGKAMDLKRIDEAVRLGTKEIWEIHNLSHMAHPFHFHGTSFRIITRDGVAPPAHETGFKDVVLVRTNETVRLATQFNHPANKAAPYMFHCHTLEHEDEGMMGQFTVT